MKLKGWPGASLVLLFTLSSTVALFFYGDRLKNESYQKLRNQLGVLEFQNVEKEKSRLVLEAAQASARKLDQFIDRAKLQTETFADTKKLRSPHTKAGLREAKKRAFLKLIKAQPSWSGGLLTDEKGRVLASAGEKPAASIAATPAFKLASRQRLTAMALEATAPDKLHLMVTVPCLTDHGIFLGVLQAKIPVTTESYSARSSLGGIVILIGTSQGRWLTPGPRKNFPEDLGTLLGKSSQEKQELKEPPAEGAEYFKGRWEDTVYLISSASLQLTQNKIFVLLEVTGLAKVIGPPSVSASLFRDPLILGGLALILVFGMVFIILFSGGSPAGIKKINHELDEMLHEAEHLVPLVSPGSGEWAKLIDSINFLINKAKAPEAPAPAGRTETDETENLTHLNRELMDLRQAHDQSLAKNMELEETVGELTSQNRELKQAVPPPNTPDNAGQLEEVVAKHEAAGRIRREAINSISEDLKTMLLVIKNYISGILSSQEGKITDAQQDFLGEVINKSARLERLISDLLDIAYLEGETSQIVLASTDIVALLEDVVLNIQAQADSKQIQLIQEVQPPLTPVMADSKRLGQVFIGLVQRALKLTPVGREVRITAAETLSDLVIKIRDSGPPSMPEESEKVFSIFHGPESPAGAGMAGTGLRFAIIKCILDIHHGTVAIRGLPGQGNEIIVSLPKGAADPEAAGATPSVQFPEEKDEDKKEERYYDLSVIMDQPKEGQETERPKIAETGEDLDKLLHDIDNIDDQLDR